MSKADDPASEDPESDVGATDPPQTKHSKWTHLVSAGDRVADMGVDIAAILAIAYIAVQGVPNGVEPAAAGTLGGMIASIALGKRYAEAKYRTK